MPEWKPPAVAVAADVVVLVPGEDSDQVLLIRRANPPHQGRWAIPGGFVEVDEDLDEAAARELFEETGVSVPTDSLVQLGAFGTPGRDPRMRVVSVVYVVRLDQPTQPAAGSDAADAEYVPTNQVLSDPDSLAFDHHRILTEAVAFASDSDSDD